MSYAGILLVLAFVLTGVAGDGKPGTCPVVAGDQGGICVQQCSNDFDCRRNEKCCSNGCGRMCQDEQGIGVPHEGLCPVVNTVNQSSVPSTCTGSAPTCSVDQDCVASQKCCHNGCNFHCIAAESPDACYHNSRIYQNKEEIVDPDGCSRCACLDGEIACAVTLCDPPTDKTKILAVCLITLGGVCFIGAILSYIKYYHSKKSVQDKNKNSKAAVNMMNDVSDV